VPQQITTDSKAVPFLLFQPGLSGVNFNGGVLTAGAQFNQFVFAAGSYKVELFGFGIYSVPANSPLEVDFVISGGSSLGSRRIIEDVEMDLAILPRSLIVTIPADNTLVGFQLNFSSFSSSATLVFSTTQVTVTDPNTFTPTIVPGSPEAGCTLLITQID
jgi:hypothetical protein